MKVHVELSTEQHAFGAGVKRNGPRTHDRTFYTGSPPKFYFFLLIFFTIFPFYFNNYTIPMYGATICVCIQNFTQFCAVSTKVLDFEFLYTKQWDKVAVEITPNLLPWYWWVKSKGTPEEMTRAPLSKREWIMLSQNSPLCGICAY